MHTCTGEGNGNPLQYSCLENPRDRGAWWATVYGVAQGWTRLKWLSSSSSSCFAGRFFAIWATREAAKILNRFAVHQKLTLTFKSSTRQLKSGGVFREAPANFNNFLGKIPCVVISHSKGKPDYGAWVVTAGKLRLRCVCLRSLAGRLTLASRAWCSGS